MSTTDTSRIERRAIRSWCLYDWANSAFVTCMTTAILPIYYLALFRDAESVAVGVHGPDAVSVIEDDEVGADMFLTIGTLSDFVQSKLNPGDDVDCNRSS